MVFDVLCVGRVRCVFVLLVVLFRWACVVPFGVVCLGRAFCWSCYAVGRAAFPLAWCVWDVFVCWSCCFVGRAAFRGVPFGVVCGGGVAGRDSDEPRGPQDQVVDRTGLR